MSGETLSFEAPLTICGQIEARAQHPATRDKVLLLQNERTWTHRQFRDESVRMAHFLRRRLDPVDEQHPGHVAMLLDNHFELLSLFGGCAYGGLILFGVNTGLRGEVLAGVVNQSRARILIVDEKYLPDVERARSRFEQITPENILVLRAQGAGSPLPFGSDLLVCLDAEVGPTDEPRDPPAVEVSPADNLMVIYTSGTTGLPKGINNNHMKLCATGMGVSANLRLNSADRGYACMPLFHSNAMFVGFMPAFWVGGSMALRERFSASQFVPDVLRYGVTFWNYVGEPVHYVLTAIEKEYGGDDARITAELARHPENKLRCAVGNGAAPPDIDRFTAWLGMEDMFEFYSSTEAAIATFRDRSCPRGSVGELTDIAAKILDADGNECPSAELDADGRVLNYDACVGEICRIGDDTGLFQGYFDNPEATAAKVRDGVYHSGDLGHILIHEGRRYLYFDGRTADWIRKDGENFSAGQVGRLLSQHPDVSLAVAYGVPCVVSDELVMAAVKLRDGLAFDAGGFLAWCEEQVRAGSMDRKWIPDFVRVVDEFEFTETQKVLVRNLKKLHFDRNRLPTGCEVFWRKRGDTAFRPFGDGDYAHLREDFAAREKLNLLDR